MSNYLLIFALVLTICIVVMAVLLMVVASFLNFFSNAKRCFDEEKSEKRYKAANFMFNAISLSLVVGLLADVIMLIAIVIDAILH